MSTPRITVGVPVYQGADLVGQALECLQQQTYGNFEAIISVDGHDEETAAACKPFLKDPRFRLVVQPDHLKWVGNFNWLLQQDTKEFFCYRQHDDTTAPNFFELLLRAADKDPRAAAIYSDCRYTGRSNHIEVAPSSVGAPLERMRQFIKYLPATPVRGIIRTSAIRQAGLVRTDEFGAPFQVFAWLAMLLHWGNFRRVRKPLYYKLDRLGGFFNEYLSRSEERKRAAWPTLVPGLLEAVMPLCHTPQERRLYQQLIFEKAILYPNFRSSPQRAVSEAVIDQCLDRLNTEGKTHLLSTEETAAVVEALHCRLDKIEFFPPYGWRKRRSAIRRFGANVKNKMLKRLGF